MAGGGDDTTYGNCRPAHCELRLSDRLGPPGGPPIKGEERRKRWKRYSRGSTKRLAALAPKAGVPTHNKNIFEGALESMLLWRDWRFLFHR
jgi:hypothetical protein